MTEFFATADGRVQVECGNCLDWMRGQADNSIAGFVTDPPYALVEPRSSRSHGYTLEHGRTEIDKERRRRGFMGKAWDGGLPGIEYWKEALRIAKPGAFLFAFGGTRTFHRLACLIEDSGWQIRDDIAFLSSMTEKEKAFFMSLNERQQKDFLDMYAGQKTILWVYSSGMLKGQNIGKAIDKAAGAEREVVGKGQSGNQGHQRYSVQNLNMGNEKTIDGRNTAPAAAYRKDEYNITIPATPLAQRFEGRHSGLAPAYEPVIVAMKPKKGTFAENAAEFDVAGLNLGECGIENDGTPPSGGMTGADNGTSFWGHGQSGVEVAKQATGQRCAKNLIHDNSPEVLSVFGRAGVSGSNWRKSKGSGVGSHWGNGKGRQEVAQGHNDIGTADRFYKSCPYTPEDKAEAARFYYCPKASKRERGRINDHSTVKPISLIQYLLRLVKQPGDQLYCDLFGGSGSHAIAAVREGMRFVVVEKDEHNCEIIRYRLLAEQPRLF